MQDVEILRIAADPVEHEHVVGNRVVDIGVETQRHRRATDQVGGGDRVPAGKQRHLVALPDQLIREVGYNSLGSAIKPRWHALDERTNLRNFHVSRLQQRPGTGRERGAARKVPSNRRTVTASGLAVRRCSGWTTTVDNRPPSARPGSGRASCTAAFSRPLPAQPLQHGYGEPRLRANSFVALRQHCDFASSPVMTRFRVLGRDTSSLHLGIGIAIIARLCSGFAEDREDLCRGRKGKAL